MQTLYQCTIVFILLILYLDFLNAAVSFIKKRKQKQEGDSIFNLLLTLILTHFLVDDEANRTIDGHVSKIMLGKNWSSTT